MKYLMLGFVLAMALTGCSGKQEPARQAAADTQAAPDIAAGKAIAEHQCKGCHGMDGKGVAPAIPTLAAQRMGYLVQSLKEYEEGKRTHAALKDMATHMSDADMRNVAAYYASLPAIVNTSVTREDLLSPYERGKAYARECAGCHGEDGNSKTPGTPTLAGQQPHYLVTAIQEYHRGDREGPMNSILRSASRLELESLALYFASQTPAVRAAPSFGNPAAGEPLSAMCGGCHGSHGVSTDAATPSLAGQDGEYLLHAIHGYKTTRRNAIMQRQVTGLTDKDIENIAAFYVVQKSKPAEQGKDLVQNLAAKCDRCHENPRENPALEVPVLNSQDREYLVMALRAYRDGRRASSAMHLMSLPISDVVIDSLASVYASRKPVQAAGAGAPAK